MLSIVIPAAGRGSRFVAAGYTIPKPFIPVNGKPMIQRVIENVTPSRPHRFIFIVLVDHLPHLPELPKGSTIIGLGDVTEGAACSVLKAKHLINSQDPLLVVNSDQLIDWGVGGVDTFLLHNERSGCIATFESDNPAYSYALLGDDGSVRQVAEKKVISKTATAGAYFWSRGSDFVRCAEAMIAANDRTRGEFYLSASYNYLPLCGLDLACGYPVKTVHALGTPEDLEKYVEEHRG